MLPAHIKLTKQRSGLEAEDDLLVSSILAGTHGKVTDVFWL